MRRDTLAALAEHYQKVEPPKGEIVLVIGPPLEETKLVDETDIDRALSAALQKSSFTQAVADVAAQTGASRKLVYARALRLKDAE